MKDYAFPVTRNVPAGRRKRSGMSGARATKARNLRTLRRGQIRLGTPISLATAIWRVPFAHKCVEFTCLLFYVLRFPGKHVVGDLGF